MNSVVLIALLVAFAVIVVGVAIFADAILDATVLGSYVLVRRALERKGRRWYVLGVGLAVLVAAIATAIGIWANIGR